jgi:hypothetical protein
MRELLRLDGCHATSAPTLDRPGERLSRNNFPVISPYWGLKTLISYHLRCGIPIAGQSGRVAPDRQGGIQFEWEKGSYALEIAISPSGSFEILKATPTVEDEGHSSFNRVRESLIWFARV